MDFTHADALLVYFDKEKQTLVFYDIYSDGDKNLYTEVPLSRLQATDIDTTCNAVGKVLLAGLPSTREALF